MKDCNFCIHNEVCGAKWAIKDDVQRFKHMELDITCKHYLPTMNEPEMTLEDMVEAINKDAMTVEQLTLESALPIAEVKKRTARKTPVKRKAVRGKAKT